MSSSDHQESESSSKQGLDESAAHQEPDSSAISDRKSQSTCSSPIDIKRPVHPESRQTGADQTKPPDREPKSISFRFKEPVPIENIIKTANNMSNMMIAHRIALEDDFRLEPGLDMAAPMMSLSPIFGSSSPSQSASDIDSARPNIQAKVKEIVHDAFWDLFREELKSQTDQEADDRKYDVSKQLLRDIKQRMIDLLLPQHTRFKQDIEDKLDNEIIDQLCKVNSINFKDYGHYVLSVLSQLCAPVRDEKIQELYAANDTVQLYRGIMELLDMMKLDFANFTIEQFKPHIKAHSQVYEREKFNEILKQQKSIGIDGLEYTRVWLDRAVTKFEASQGSLKELVKGQHLDRINDENLTDDIAFNTDAMNQEKSIEQSIIDSDLITKILNSAYCELLEWTPDLQKFYPETLLCDESTFKHLSGQTKLLISTSAILLTTFAFVNRYKVSDDPNFKNLIKSHVVTLLTATYTNVQDDQHHQSSSSTPTVPPATGFSARRTTEKQTTKIEDLDQNKLETIVTRLKVDLRSKVEKDSSQMLDDYDKQCELFRRQILDLENSSNRVRELSKRRIFEFIDTLLTLDVKHQQKKKMPPPVNIPLGLNCLANEITLITAQLVKIIRYNRRVFYNHYRDIIVESITRRLKSNQ